MGVINLGALVEKLRKKMSGDFISKTDYPSGDNAGVIKVDSTYATSVTTGGKLKASAITAEAYSEANDGAFISKATLDNVLAAQPAAGMTIELVAQVSSTSSTGKEIVLESGKSWDDYKAFIMLAKNGIKYKGFFILPKAVFPDNTCNVVFDSQTFELYKHGSDPTKKMITSTSSYNGPVYFYGVK